MAFIVGFQGCTYSQCEWRSDSLVSNTDTTEIKEAEEN
jgi:hypothetical protein